MAKTIKAKKQQFFILNNLLPKAPEIKDKDASVKLSNFYRAIKKPIRDILDERAELNKIIEQKIEGHRKKFNELNPRIETLSKVEKLSEEGANNLSDLKIEIMKNDADANAKTKKEREALDLLGKKLEDEEGEAVCDNEDFLYVESLFKNYPQIFFSIPAGENKTLLDINTMEQVYELFDKAQ